MDLENFCGFTQQEHIPCTLRAYKNPSHIGHVHPHRCRNSHSRKAYFTLCGLIPPSAQRARPSSSLLKFSQQEHIPCTLRAYKNPSHIGHVHPHPFASSLLPAECALLLRRVFIIQPVERIVFLLCEFFCEKRVAKGFYYTARGENCVPAVRIIM